MISGLRRASAWILEVAGLNMFVSKRSHVQRINVNHTSILTDIQRDANCARPDQRGEAIETPPVFPADGTNG